MSAPRSADGMGMSALLHASRSWCAALVPVAAALAQAPAPTQDPLLVTQQELALARAELAELRAAMGRPPIVSGSLGVTMTNEYLFRGIAQEDRGVIAQPWLELGFLLHEGCGLLHDVQLTAGIWNSLHDGPTGGAGSMWYEADVYAGLSAGLGERWTIGTTYTVYHSPNGTFGTVEEIAASLAFDDSELWLPTALQPSLLLSFELDGQADAGRGLGICAELGIEPRIAFASIDGFEIDLLVPLKVGFSVRDYYELPGGGGDKAFGYFQAGLVLAAALPGLPDPGRPWTLEVGMHYLVLGDSNEARNGGDGSELLATLTLGTSF